MPIAYDIHRNTFKTYENDASYRNKLIPNRFGCHNIQIKTNYYLQNPYCYILHISQIAHRGFWETLSMLFLNIIRTIYVKFSSLPSCHARNSKGIVLQVDFGYLCESIWLILMCSCQHTYISFAQKFCLKFCFRSVP